MSSDYYLFRSIQHSLSDRKCEDVFDVQNFIKNFITSKLDSFYQGGIQKLK